MVPGRGAAASGGWLLGRAAPLLAEGLVTSHVKAVGSDRGRLWSPGRASWSTLASTTSSTVGEPACSTTAQATVTTSGWRRGPRSAGAARARTGQRRPGGPGPGRGTAGRVRSPRSPSRRCARPRTSSASVRVAAGAPVSASTARAGCFRLGLPGLQRRQRPPDRAGRHRRGGTPRCGGGRGRLGARDIASYFFLGGVAGGSALLAAGADLTGRPGATRHDSSPLRPRGCRLRRSVQASASLSIVQPCSACSSRPRRCPSAA